MIYKAYEPWNPLHDWFQGISRSIAIVKPISDVLYTIIINNLASRILTCKSKNKNTEAPRHQITHPEHPWPNARPRQLQCVGTEATAVLRQAIDKNTCSYVTTNKSMHMQKGMTQLILTACNYAWYRWFKIDTIIWIWAMICLNKSLAASNVIPMMINKYYI